MEIQILYTPDNDAIELSIEDFTPIYFVAVQTAPAMAMAARATSSGGVPPLPPVTEKHGDH